MKKTRWDVLSVKDKASLIKLFVNSGVTSLNDMIGMYNTHTFDTGGNKDKLELSGGVLPGATITSKKVERRNTPGKDTFIPSNFIVPIEQPIERKAQLVNNYLVDQYNTIQEDIRDYLNNTTFLGDPVRTPNESLQYLKDLQDEQQYLEDLSAIKNINRYSRGGNLYHKYDGDSEPTGQMMLIGEDGNPIDVLPGAVTTYNTLSDYNRRQVKRLARNDYANVGEKTRDFDKDWQTRVYNRAWNRADREYRNQENRKALKRAAIQELQTGIPTGAFNEYTKEGIEDMAPFAMGLVTSAAGPALGGLKTAGEVMRAAGTGYNTVNTATSYALSNVARLANNTIGKTKLGSWGLKGAGKTLKLLENLAPSTHVQNLLDTIGVNHASELYTALPTIADSIPGLASYLKSIDTVANLFISDTSEEEQKYKRRLVKDGIGLAASIALPIAGANVRKIHNASYVKNLINNQKAFDSITDRVGARLGSSQRVDTRFIDTNPNNFGVTTLGTNIGLNPENLKRYSRKSARSTLAHEANHMHRSAIGDPLVDPQSWVLYGYHAPNLVDYPQYQKWYPDKTRFGQWGYSPEEVLSDIAGYKEIAGITDAGFSNLSKTQKRRLVRYIKTRGGNDLAASFPKWNKKEIEELLKQFEKDNIKFTNGGYLYKTGGRINKRSFSTTLNKKREAEFQDWYSKIAKILNLDSNPDNQEHGYDYRGYWLENRKKDIDYSSPEFHFPDTWKQPWHETFSNESQYANMKYGINPESVGHWEGETFVPGVYNDIMGGRSPQSEFLKTKEWAEGLIGPPKPSVVYTPSNSIIEYIKSTEGFSPVWYKDGNGVDTIGYGFTGEEVKKLFPKGITREQADKYFSDNLAKRVKVLQRDTPNWDVLNQNQRDSLLSYHYNIGEGSYRNKSPKMQKALREKDWKTVTENIDFGYNDSANKGLRKRRDYERALFNTPVETKTSVQYKCGGKLKRKNRIYVE